MSRSEIIEKLTEIAELLKKEHMTELVQKKSCKCNSNCKCNDRECIKENKESKECNVKECNVKECNVKECNVKECNVKECNVKECKKTCPLKETDLYKQMLNGSVNKIYIIDSNEINSDIEESVNLSNLLLFIFFVIIFIFYCYKTIGGINCDF